jgi:hypothetical protein
MRLGRHYGRERLEAACRRAVLLDVCTYRSIKSILATATDHRPLPSGDEARGPAILHENLRGRDYYAPAEPATGPQEGDSKIWPEPRSSHLGDPKESFLLQRTQGILKS